MLNYFTMNMTTSLDSERRWNQYARHIVLITWQSQENCKKMLKNINREIKDVRVIPISGFMRF